MFRKWVKYPRAYIKRIFYYTKSFDRNNIYILKMFVINSVRIIYKKRALFILLYQKEVTARYKNFILFSLGIFYCRTTLINKNIFEKKIIIFKSSETCFLNFFKKEYITRISINRSTSLFVNENKSIIKEMLALKRAVFWYLKPDEIN